jgi:hypothetical protein
MTGEFYNRERHSDETLQEAGSLDQEYAYTRRLERLTTAATEFETAAIEAEVLWGNKGVAVRNEVVGICNRITAAYVAYFPGALRDARAGRDVSDDLDQQRRILFVTMDDPFGHEAMDTITRAIAAFRAFLFDQAKESK